VTKLTSPKKQEEKATGEETEHHALKFFIYPFEVIVSPFKAFKEIAQNPTVKGFALLVVLIIVTSVGLQYAYASKMFVSISDRQQISPKLYTSTDAYVYVTTFGNYTFKSGEPHIMNYTLIDKTPLTEFNVFWVNTTETLTPANPLVPIANDTFYQATVDLNQSARKVGNLTLTAKFYPDERPNFSVLLTKTEEWNLSDFTINWFMRSPYTYLANRITTIDLASKATLSLLETNAEKVELGNTSSLNDWRSSILGDWSGHGNATIYGGNHTLFSYSDTWLGVVFDANDPKIDLTTVGLTYFILLNTNLVSGYLLLGAIQATLAFFFSWIIYAGALFLISKIFDGERIHWRPFFTIIGYVFSVVIVRAVVSAVLILTLPEINFQMASWPPTQAEATLANEKINAIWGPTLVFYVGTYLNLFVEFWFAILGAIAVHASHKIAWKKATMFSVLAYLLYFTARLFIGF